MSDGHTEAAETDGQFIQVTCKLFCWLCEVEVKVEPLQIKSEEAEISKSGQIKRTLLEAREKTMKGISSDDVFPPCGTVSPSILRAIRD